MKPEKPVEVQRQSGGVHIPQWNCRRGNRTRIHCVCVFIKVKMRGHVHTVNQHIFSDVQSQRNRPWMLPRYRHSHT